MSARLLLPLLALLAAAAPYPPPPRGAGVLTLAPDSETRWVPFDLTPGNQIRFDMTLDGKPAVAILDTGVSHSVLARRSAEARGLALRPGGQASAIGGSVSVGQVDTARLAFGGLVREGGVLAVAALPDNATGSARPVDLLIGRDLLARYALEIDYEARRFRLLPSGRMPFTGIAAPLAVSPDKQVYVGEARLGSARLKPMVVDTGDGSAITLAEAQWRAAAQTSVPTTTAIAYGLAGPVVSIVAVVPEIAVGALVARQVEVRVEPRGGFSEAIGVAGRIGSGFLQNYRVLLDPGAGRMVLAPGPKANQPPLRSTSGILVGVLPDRLRVLHVMRASPAALSGWKEGEAICRVDGQPIPPGYATSPLAGWSAGAPGRVVRLGLCDGGERLLTLRRFY